MLGSGKIVPSMGFAGERELREDSGGQRVELGLLQRLSQLWGHQGRAIAAIQRYKAEVLALCLHFWRYCLSQPQ